MLSRTSTRVLLVAVSPPLFFAVISSSLVQASITASNTSPSYPTTPPYPDPWTTSSLFVGDFFPGSMIIDGGSDVINNGEAKVARHFPPDNSMVRVSGAGSTWTNSGTLYMAYSGPGTLDVTAGGSVSNTVGYIGFDSISNGTVNVGGGSGTSTWTNTNLLWVGYSGTGKLDITGGGTVSSFASYVGGGAGSNGTVNVGGGNGASSWTHSNELWVGNGGTGSMVITGGGSVSNATGQIGVSSGGNGIVTVDGTAGIATWTNSSWLRVGANGTGILNVVSGGAVFNTEGIIGLTGGNGTVNVSGGTSTSRWTNSNELYVGANNTGTGTMNVMGGGIVSNTTAYIGYSSGSTGTVNVGGGAGNSTWTNSGQFLSAGAVRGNSTSPAAAAYRIRAATMVPSATASATTVWLR